jgi:hypothetical protein
MLPETIRLNFFNRTGADLDASLLVFQRNVASPQASVIAWRAISGLPAGESYLVSVPSALQVSAIDAQGNDTGRVDATAQMQVVDNGIGPEFAQSDEAIAAVVGNAIAIQNMLAVALTVHVYRDDLLLAQQEVAAGQSAHFEFKALLWVGIVSGAEEGMPLSDAILQTVNTELSLLGIHEADVAITGGGNGDVEMPYAFDLGNLRA